MRLFPIIRRIVSGGGGGVQGEKADSVGADDALSRVSPLLPDSVGMADNIGIRIGGGDGSSAIKLSETAGLADDHAATVTAADVAQDTVGVTDSPAAATALSDSVGATDSPAPNPALPDTFAVTDHVGQASPTLPDTAGLADALDVDLSELLPNEDGEVQQGDSGTNFGAATTAEVRAPSALGNGEQRYLTAWDFTWADDGDGFAAQTPLTLHIHVAQNGILTRTLVYTVYASAAKPFEEDTLTWDNQPAPGTEIGSGSISVAVGAAQNFNEDILTAGEWDSGLGNWIWIRFTNSNTVDRPTFTVSTKENATVGDRPDLTGTLRKN